MKALAASPVSYLLARGKAAFHAGAYATALQVFDEVLTRHPDYADVHNLRGLCLVSMNLPAEALNAFDRAIEINSEFVDALVNRGRVLYQLGRQRDAQLSIQRSMELREREAGDRYPSEFAARAAETHAELGDLYAEKGFFLEASMQYRCACELRPDFVDMRNKLGSTLLELALYEAAIRELRRALVDNPNYLDARINLGLALFRSGNEGAARQEWHHCLALDPTHMGVQNCLAMLEEENLSARACR